MPSPAIRAWKPFCNRTSATTCPTTPPSTNYAQRSRPGTPMHSRLPLETLIGLAKESTDEAARTLGRLNAERSHAERQLSMLHDYRQDYLQRLQAAMQASISSRKSTRLNSST